MRASHTKKSPAKESHVIDVGLAKNKYVARTVLLLFSLAFAVLAYNVLGRSHAATPFAGPGTVGHDANIAGIHTPATLTTVSNGMTTTADGQIIEKKDIQGGLFVKHKNVIVRDSKMRILNISPTGSVTCEWCTIGDMNGIRQNDPQLGAEPYNGVGMYNFKLFRSNVFGTVDILKLRSGYAEVRESWLHDAIQWTTDPAQKNPDGTFAVSHTDFLQTVLDGDVSYIKLVDNYWDAWVFGENQKVGDTWRNLSASRTATGIISLFQQGTNFRIHNVEVTGNIFNGDAYYIMYDLNNNYNQPIDGVKFTGNRLYQNYPAYGKNAMMSVSTPSSITWGCNSNETGASVAYAGSTSTTNCTPFGAVITNPTPADFSIKGILAGSTVSGSITVETSPINATTPSFDYYIDGTLVNTEQNAPFCFYSELSGACQAYDTSKLVNGAHVLKVTMTHSGGQLSKTVNFNVINTTADTTPPSMPSGLNGNANAYNKIDLSWGASTDNVGVTGYTIWRNGSAFSTVATTSFSDTTVSAKTSYAYFVTAKDAAGNVSVPTGAVTVVTPSAPDTTPPTAPTGLTTTPISSSQINLTWAASSDNIGVSGYEVWRANGTKLMTVTTTSYGVTGLTAGTTYNFYVKALDAAGNVSSQSSTVSATTLVAPTPPAQSPGNLTGTLTGDSGSLRRPRISLVYNGSTHAYTPSKDGSYTITSIPIGTYNVTYSARGYKSQVMSVTMTSGSTTVKNVTLGK